jgi:uncharacterized membrane protein YdjX (TVP38/TMEM64 family)
MRLRLIGGIIVVILLVTAYVFLSKTGALAVLMDETKLHALVRDLGWYGPVVLIGLMATAIVMSPIPSAPIALAAGMAYGHAWGTIFVAIGAEIGAIIAFVIGRMVGYAVLHRWFGERLQTVKFFGSQNMMTATVFISRLLPFLSFDVVSYMAGFTPLLFWRFALATLAGIIPISFLLAHFGSEIALGDSETIMPTVLLLGGVTLLPFLGKWLWDRFWLGRKTGRR